MNAFREIEWDLFAKRMFALLIDTLIFITVFTLLIRIFNVFMPGNDVREDAMQFYTQKDFRVFISTSASVLILLGLYMLLSYKSARGQTVGHRLARIRIVNPQSLPIGGLAFLRVLLVAWLRILVLLIPGPFVAFHGGKIIFSVFALIWGCLLILPIPLSKKSKITLWEKSGGYKFIKDS